MIDTAERLAAERGLNGLSLREVQLASGQRNKSAASYHFGTREGLIQSVVVARMGPINERRLAELAAIEAAGTPTLRQLVEILVLPLAEATAKPGSTYARFLLQGLADPVMGEIVRGSMESRSIRAVRDRIMKHLGHLPKAMRERRMIGCVHLMVATLAGWESAAGKVSAPARRDLVDMCLAVLNAPVTAAAASPSKNRPALPADPPQKSSTT